MLNPCVPIDPVADLNVCMASCSPLPSLCAQALLLTQASVLKNDMVETGVKKKTGSWIPEKLKTIGNLDKYWGWQWLQNKDFTS